ncbi:MAG: hypothetical protein RSB37_07740 [Acetivibrio sp.]
MNEEVQCNVCGKKIKKENGIYREDFLLVTKEWGYFSEKDIEKHSFRVCETCYDQWIRNFTIPVKKEKISEIV